MSTFTTQGFFDKAGYVEPVSDAHKKKVIAWSVSLLVIALVIAGIVVYFVFFHKKAEKKLKKAQMEKIHAE